jgi:hypothetical protein
VGQRPTEHASAGQQDDGQLDAPFAGGLLSLRDLGADVRVPLSFLLRAVAVVFCVRHIERVPRCGIRRLEHAQEEDEDAREERGVFAYPYRGYQAVGVEWRGRGERGQRRAGRGEGGVFGGDELPGREADVFLDEDDVEGLGAVWGPDGGTQPGLERVAETGRELGERVLRWLCSEPGDEHHRRKLGQQLDGIRVHGELTVGIASPTAHARTTAGASSTILTVLSACAPSGTGCACPSNCSQCANAPHSPKVPPS